MKINPLITGNPKEYSARQASLATVPESQPKQHPTAKMSCYDCILYIILCKFFSSACENCQKHCDCDCKCDDEDEDDDEC